jgi:hypothetical protein
MLAGDAAERLANGGVLGVERLTGDTAGTGYGGYAAAQRRQRKSLAGGRQISADDMWGGRHRLEAVLLAPGLVV